MTEQTPDSAIRTLMQRLENALGSLGQLVLGAMGVVVAFQIIMRVLPTDYGAVWTTEIARYLLVIMTLTGIPYAMRRGSHISIRPLLRMLTDSLQKYLTTFSNLLVIAMCGIGIWSAVSVIEQTLVQSLPTVGWLRVGYLMIYLAIAFALCIVFIVEKMVTMWVPGLSEPGAKDHPVGDVEETTEEHDREER
ncbi:TRAP transporter small permease [Haloarcula sp. CBA1130]|uniref:TRAP transporter small permease n=1 Tax=unclassified Haloarcula TaxID=2624677 RepID=UPI001243ABFE|nr:MULTISPECIES: TRAP transporter small permease [unclassified Haloarcula]KAA9396332.1 TRAP transporter small permease [Haloarcula sp. CBA1130]KAA9398315.1 TRAP transporter small permease [Haloarcula sp. CBA1129]